MNSGSITASITAITAGRWKAKRLIVNADDLALHPAVNRAVFRAHREGIVTSTTILVGGSAFMEAVEGLKKYPNLGMGVHLCLIDQNPVADPQKIPSLLDERSRFHASYREFLKSYLLRKISLEEVEIELEEQVSRAVDSGLKITHFDSHQHLHLLPRLLPIVARIGAKFGIGRIRIPADARHFRSSPAEFSRKLQGAFLSGLAERARKDYQRLGLISTDAFFGFACGGRCGIERWRECIPRLRNGVTEIMVHPGENNVDLGIATGWDYAWETELAALTSPEIADLLAQHDIQLVNYRDVI